MRQISKFFIAAVVAASVVSCDLLNPKDPDDNPSNNDPPSITISINGQAGANVTIEEGAAVNLSINYSAPAGFTQIDMKQENGNNLAGFPKSDFDNSGSYQYQGTIPANLLPVGINRFTTKVTDKNNKSDEKTMTITVNKKGNPIHTWANKTLGSLAHASTAGSSFSSSDGNVYSIANAKTNSAKVDLIYSNGATYPFALVAPNLPAIGPLPENSTNRVETWATINATKLAKLSSVTVAEFDGCTDDKLIDEKVTSATVSANNVTNLTANNIVGFITAGGKKGLIKVISTDTSSSANQSITITVKVQK